MFSSPPKYWLPIIISCELVSCPGSLGFPLANSRLEFIFEAMATAFALNPVLLISERVFFTDVPLPPPDAAAESVHPSVVLKDELKVTGIPPTFIVYPLRFGTLPDANSPRLAILSLLRA